MLAAEFLVKNAVIPLSLRHLKTIGAKFIIHLTIVDVASEKLESMVFVVSGTFLKAIPKRTAQDNIPM
jgi:hypothetical protein